MTGVFTAGSVLTAANLNTAINSLTLNAQSSAGYTLVLADAGKLVTLSNASAQNLTIPLNSSVAYATGTVIEVLNIGAGTWTLTPTGGVTLTGSTSIPTSARVRLTKTGTDTWYANALGGGALTLINKTDFTASSAVNVNSVFTTTYNVYRVVCHLVHASADRPKIRMRASGTDATGATDYSFAYVNAASSAASGATGTTSSWLPHQTTANGSIMTFDLTVINPASAVFTQVFVTGFEPSPTVRTGGGRHAQSIAYDGFSITPETSATMTGSVYVYGYSIA